MIDVMAIATSGYISTERSNFSTAIDGYYVSTGIAIRPETPVYGKILIKLRNEKKEHILREEDELKLIIKIFMDIWDL